MNRRAFTIIELLQGMLLCALIAGAAASFLTATSKAWGYSENTQTFVTSRSQAMQQMRNLMGNARLVGAISNATDASNLDGQSAALIWRGDDNDDGKIQQGELVLLLHNTSTRELQRLSFENNSPTVQWARAVFLSDDAINGVKSMAAEATVLVRQVDAAHFTIRRPDADVPRSLLGYHLTVTRRGEEEQIAGAVAMRAVRSDPP